MARSPRCSYLPLAIMVLTWIVSFLFSGMAFGQQANTFRSKPQNLDSHPVKLPPPLRVSAKLSVRPKSVKGTCPATFVFSGEIKATRPATVEYRFVRSDNSRSNSSTLSFHKPGSQTVTDTWQLGDESLASYEGWEAIEIVSPIRAESRKAFFSMECRQEEKTGGRRKGR